MPHMFAAQNELGRLCDEEIYEADVAARLQAAGFGPVRRQVPVTIRFQDFAKTYYLDLVVNDAALYELKAVLALLNEHKAQMLNYVFILGLRSAKLVNFRAPKVQSEFVSTSISKERRCAMHLERRRWRPVTDECKRLEQTMIELLQEWGGFLEVALYEEAIAHFFGGAARVWTPMPLRRGDVDLGLQPIARHHPEVAFRLTALTDDTSNMEAHLRRLLALMPVRAMQWINLNHFTAQFTTLEKG